MNSVSSGQTDQGLFDPYIELLARLLPEASGFALADREARTLGSSGEFPRSVAEAWLRDLNLSAKNPARPPVHSRMTDASDRLLGIELRGAEEALTGVLLACLPESMAHRLWPDPAMVAANRLQAVLPLLTRDLAALDRTPVETQVHRTAIAKHADSSDAVVDWLREALEQDRMQLFAQRIMPLQDFKEPSGYELLVRLRDEDGHIVSPEEFLSAAYRYQLLPAVDRWVMEHAVAMLEPFANVLQNSEVSIAINVSGQSLGDRLFVRRLAERLSAAGIPPARIVLEIAEQTARGDVAQAVETMRQLRQLGCGVALDDFGRSASSLACLDDFPVTRIKLDGNFIRNILTSPQAEETARTLVRAARTRGIDTVAVFVENEHIARKVRALGLDYAQGYAIAKPLPLEGVLRDMQKDAARCVNLGKTQR